MTFVVNIKPLEFRLNDEVTIYCEHVKSSDTDRLYTKAKDAASDKEFITDLIQTIGFIKEGDNKKAVEHSIIDMFEEDDFKRFASLYERLRLSTFTKNVSDQPRQGSLIPLKDLFVKHTDQINAYYKESFEKIMNSTKISAPFEGIRGLSSLNSAAETVRRIKEDDSLLRLKSDLVDSIESGLSGSEYVKKFTDDITRHGLSSPRVTELGLAAMYASAERIKAQKTLDEVSALNRERIVTYTPPPYSSGASMIDVANSTNKILREQLEQSRLDNIALQALINVSEKMANELTANQNIALKNSESAEKVAKKSINIAIITLILSCLVSGISIYLTKQSIDVAIQIGKDSPSEETLKTYIEAISNQSATDRELWLNTLKESAATKKANLSKKTNDRVKR